MKNKKNGFTLVEMILVVAIMGSLAVIFTISLNATLNNTNEKKCEEFIKEVEDAACVYASMSDRETVCNRTYCEPIRLELLIKNGLVTSEYNYCADEEINIDDTVSVTWNEYGEKICTFNGVK